MSARDPSVSASAVSASATTASGVSTSGLPNGITVLVSTTIHPQSGRPCTSRNDTLALEIARQLSGGSHRTLHVGDPQDAALPDYLAFGANSVEVLPAVPGGDTVSALAEQLSSTRLVLCGTRAQSGEASGMLPYLLAAALKRPILADVLEVQLLGDSVQATQFLPKGRRRTVTVSLPAIIAVHPLATVLPRYAYARRVAGRVETLSSAKTSGAHSPVAHNASASPQSNVSHVDTHAATDATAPSAPTAGADAASAAASPAASSPSPWTLEPTDRVPVKLKAPDRRSGHARMLSATAAASRGGQVVNHGSDVEKAQAVLAYLREHDLIAF
jgi:electron transfer flavoprotein beta subunit